MPTRPTPMTEQDAAARRSGVRRTVFVFAAIALVIYAAFILSGVLAR